MNTTGYKTVRFEDIIDADGSVHGKERIDNRVGDYQITKNPLDVALGAAGYFAVTTKDGEIRYTRDGSFNVNKDGMLTTKTGSLVGSGIYIDASAEKTEIRPNGDVYTYKKIMDEPEYSGTIPIVRFENPDALKDMGGSEFSATEESGKISLVEEPDFVKQYGLEHSNVDPMNEVYKVARINASILASASLEKAIREMYDTVIQDITT
jgi:flagellar basal-body rod protein FlgG